MADVLIIIGSESDLKIAEKAQNVLKEFGVPFETKVISFHRNPEKLIETVRKATAEGTKVFIGVAGLAAHLPGAIATHTDRIVIGVPVNVKLEGLDALLSMVQMPRGVPIAAVGVDGGENAALLAIQILAMENPKLREKFLEYKKNLAK
ncbi:MAG: 5-(carboxyamino)imidazole ribonucleotide mutase [Euryarchaeota archaeon]|nr:5-(carboxyamino)imidazole ribonucleotide mutase [Euryarchaeota archaeon]